jgi:hypothetical protein
MTMVARWALVGSLGAAFDVQQSTLPAPLVRADREPVGLVETEIRQVRYHAIGAVLDIRSLRGRLVPVRAGVAPWFEDRNSFTISVDTADISIDPASLTTLLSAHVFHYPGSPLSHLAVTIENGQLKQKGHLHHLPFTILATASPTTDGRLRIHPTSVKVLGISVKGLMHRFGLELDNLLKVGLERGVEVAGDDILLSSWALVPPPIIRGRITGVSVGPGSIRVFFGGAKRSEGRAATLATARDPAGPNYLLFRGGVLRFGKLTMADADLLIVDADPKDPFDFDIVHLNDQLVAGQTKNRVDFGLVTVMPDYHDLPK